MDPYKALGLSHSANPEEIKRSYRELARKYHPDRLAQDDEKQRQQQTTRFAEIAEAYAMLSDPSRKAQYDHIYKYGGFDDIQEEKKVDSPPRYSSTNKTKNTTTTTSTQSRKRKQQQSKGIGYTCTDPLAFLWTQGEIHSTTTMAGIQIPSRIQMGGGSLRFAFSSAQRMYNRGTQKYVCKTTQFAQGKKFTRTETTVVHPDGRREVVIQDNDDVVVERRSTGPPTTTTPQQKPQEDVLHEEDPLPWYVNTWHVIKDKLSMCYSPCTVVQ